MNWQDYKTKALESLTKRYIDAGGKSLVMLKAAPVGTPQDAGVSRIGDPFEITCFATRATVDLEGDVVLPEGGDVTSYFAKNRTLFVDHEYDVMKAVGKCRWLKPTPSGWLCKSALIQNRENKYRNQVEALALSGNIGHSIGMEVLDYSGPTVDERKTWPGATGIIRLWRLLEISYTAIPMNADCQSDMPTAEKSAAKRVVIL